MVKFLSLRKFTLVSLGLCALAFTGCPSPTNNGSAPANAPAPQAAASPAFKSATPNSFDNVTAQLDPGGDLYFYLSTEQWLGKLSDSMDSIHDLIFSNLDTQGDDRANAEKAFAMAKDIVQKSGLQDISGVGASSINLSPGLYRNKLFVHHYPDKGSGILWSLFGTTPHDLTGLDLLPPDTAMASVGDFDLAKLINFLRQEASQSGIPDLQTEVTQLQTLFAGNTGGLQLDDVLASLSGTMGAIVTLDATGTVTIPVTNPPQTIPTPRLAILLSVTNDLIFKQVDQMTASMPNVIKVDEPDLRMRTMPQGSPIPGFDFRPSLAQWNGFLILASDDKLIRDIVATQKNGGGFKTSAEFAALSANMPQQGNAFALATQRFVDTLRQLQAQMIANTPNHPSAAMQQYFSKFQTTGHAYTVNALAPNGWLSVNQGAQGAAQMLVPLLIIPATAIPLYFQSTQFR